MNPLDSFLPGGPMKIKITTDDDRVIAVFEDAEDLDYLDYSAELDQAIRWRSGRSAGDCQRGCAPAVSTLDCQP